MYEEALSTFSAAGLEQYEISNFSQPGMASKHNLRYWQRRPYLGLGLDASSMLRAADGTALRATTTDDLAEYLKAAAANAETAWLGATQQLEEAWFLGLRRNVGISLAQLRAEFGARAIEPSIAAAYRLAKDGLLTIEDEMVCLTDRGRLISNDVFAEFLGLSPLHESEPHVATAR
jgi:oxygen-independent coproporphyrinogen-3 oxidase